MAVEVFGPSPAEKVESERQAALNAYMAARGIKDGEKVEDFDLIYQGKYEDWIHFAEAYAYFTEDYQALTDNFGYGASAEELRSSCEVEKKAGGVIIRDYNLDGGERTIHAKSFKDYARKIAKETIINPEDYVQLDSYCDYEALAKNLKKIYFACPADGGVFIYWNV